jgi:hypothetical protein
MNMIETIKAARRVSTPLLAISTADQHEVVKTVCEAFAAGEHPKVHWDCADGLKPLNKPAEEALARISKDQLEYSQAPIMALKLAQLLPEHSMLFMHNVHRHLDDPSVVQGVSNLRDPFKENRRTLVMLGPGFSFRPELSSDVVVLEEPLPNDEAVTAIAKRLYSDAQLKDKWDDDTGAKIVDASRGLSAFAIEQVIALSMTRAGANVTDCWQRKRAAVNQTRGLKLSHGGPTFKDIGGLDAIKTFGSRLFDGGEPPRGIVRLDEIEKMMAGASGDNTGVSQDFLSTWLKWMEDNGHSGLIAVGLPGGGKSLYSKALGSTHGVPTIEVDMGAWKQAHVGESELNARAALRSIESVVGGRAFVVATCNKLDVLPSELRRRFKGGTWFFDLPTIEERESIWKVNLKAWEIKKPGPRPDDSNWTGAEIRNCCELAWQLGCSLKEAAKFIVPVAVADPEGLERLRSSAAGKFLSASTEGPYSKPTTAPRSAGGRKMEVE